MIKNFRQHQAAVAFEVAAVMLFLEACGADLYCCLATDPKHEMRRAHLYAVTLMRHGVCVIGEIGNRCRKL